MTPDGRRKTEAEGSRSGVVRHSSVVGLAGALLGLFLSRFWYELDPIRFAVLGDWPASIALVLVGMLFLFAQWRLALRRVLPLDAVLPVHAPFALLLIYVLWPQVDPRLAATVLLASVGLATALGLRAIAEGSMLPTALRVNRSVWLRFAPVALAAIVLGLYLRTLGAHVGKADTFEFQVVAPTLGVAHPTGYPLYVMIGKLFSLLPIGSIAYRVNLTSALFSAAAAVMVYALAVRLSERRLTAFLAALSFAVSGVVWSQAVVAEVYALNALIAGLVLSLLVDLCLRRRPSPKAEAFNIRFLFFVLGLGLSHHLTAILLLPAAGLAVVTVRPRLPIRTTLSALGLFLLGLAMWLYIPLRWPALHGGASMTPSEFVDWITGARFGGALVLDAWSDPTRWEIVTRFLLDAFGPLGAVLAAVGLVTLTRQRRYVGLVTFVTFAAYVFYGLVYFVPDVSVFLIPAYLVMGIWIGVGAAALTRWLEARLRIRVHAPAVIVLALIPIGLINHNFPRVDQRDAGQEAESWGRAVLDLPIRAGAAILVDSEKIAPLYYLQVTEDLRPDLDVLVLGTEQEYRLQLDARLAQGQPVYLARFLPDTPYPMRSLGPLVEVLSGRTPTPDESMRTGPTFGDVLELVNLSYGDGDPAWVTFGWRALTDSRPNYHVRLQLVDANGRVWWEDPGAHPVNGYYPTGAWAAGEVVTDYHEVHFDPATPPGSYSLQVGWFPPFHDDGLLTENGEAWWPAAELNVPRVAAPRLEAVMRQTFGSKVAVVGITPPGRLPQSSPGQLRLNWARTGAVEDSGVRFTLSLVDATGHVVEAEVAEPYDGALSVKDWPLGVRQAALDFQTPERGGVYTLRLGFVDRLGKPWAAKCGWLAPASTDCALATVEVEGEALGDSINFDNQVLLTDWLIDRAEMRPGETIHVRLAWRGLRSWEADHTVTVQLIGPDGRLHGQTDAWPVQGTLPTTAWVAGQTVNDPYAVTLQPDAPSGRYQVTVGWYLLATLRRLPVLDAGGRAIDDRFVVGEFDVP